MKYLKKKTVIAVMSVMCVLAAPLYAHAVTDIDSIRLSGQVPGGSIEPFDMTCKDFMALSPEINLFTASWLDGYSSPSNDVSMFIPGDAKDFLKELGKACAANPDKVVNDVIGTVQYGNTSDPVPPRCVYLNSLESEMQAGLLIAWAMGYVISGDQEMRDIINFDELAVLANAVIRQCGDNASASVLELVEKELR